MPVASLQEHFSELTDPRRREVMYPLINVVVIAVCAVICGADDFVAIAKWGRTKRDWLAKFLDLSAGIPSHDRFNAILAALKPAEFEQCLLSWITALYEVTDGQIIPIDGKTLRRSFDKASGKAAIHRVNRQKNRGAEGRLLSRREGEPTDAASGDSRLLRGSSRRRLRADGGPAS